MVKTRIVSSLEKPLPGTACEAYPELRELSALRGERINFQVLFEDTEPAKSVGRTVKVVTEGIDVPVSVRLVGNVVADMPYFACDTSVGTPGVIQAPGNAYPDVLLEMDRDALWRLRPFTVNVLWVECTPDKAGVWPLTVKLVEGDGTVAAEAVLPLTVVDASLPEQSLVFTEWFHSDCLASYYHVPIFSEEHWRIIENYLRCAVRNGINCLLTPVLTPPLDTEIGSERPAVQLVGITRENGTYSFDFSLLERWVDMAHRCGIRYFEISHLFTQWGAEFAPMGVVKDRELGEQHMFGWKVSGTSGEYPVFLQSFLPALVEELRKLGILDVCRFHISDEPNAQHLEGYMKARNIVAPYLKGCVLMDALSDVAFYQSGAVMTPIPGSDGIEPFLKEDIPERWTYYCCGQWDKVGNRFIAYPSFRNRILGVQLYKFGMFGFLHWGYNFYYTHGSRRLIDPYTCQSGEGWVESGDAFSVYPGSDGQPVESLRLAVFYEAIQDIDALKLAERLAGRDAVVRLIDETAGFPVTFSDYPMDASYLLTLRTKVNALIAEKSGQKEV